MRLLLVSYHFGHGSATGGLRWNAMTRHLAEAGWTVDVVAANKPQRSGGADAPYSFAPGVTVYTVDDPVWPARTFELMRRIGRAVRPRRPASSAAGPMPAMRPEDARVWRPETGQRWYSGLAGDFDAARTATTTLGWARRAAEAALALGRRHQYAATVVSTPPHFVQAAGPRIAHALGVPYFADLRDPWMLAMVRAGRLERALNARYERRLLRTAHTVICNTERCAQALARLGTAGPARLAAIPNGYDKLDRVLPPDPKCFRVAFTGWLYPSMDPRPLFEACGRLRVHHGLDPAAFEITFMGTDPNYGTVPLQALASAFGVGAHFHLLPRGGRDDALRMQMSAAVLPVFDYLQPYAVTTKFYDHVQMQGSLLLMGHGDGALGDAARRVSVPVCAPGDVSAIAGVLESAYARWCAQDYTGPTDRLGVFDRRLQSARLDALLRASVGPPR